jgi:hypothetical protein
VQLKPYIQYAPEVAKVILETSGRGSFIAPAVGFLHYGPSCYLYDHVCNFNYQGWSLLLAMLMAP